MWKWIGGAFLIIVLALAGTCYAGYRRLTATGDSITVTIRGGADRVFTALSSPDSMMAWLPAGSEITPTRPGPFQPGDTVRVATPSSRSGSARTRTDVYVVREVHAPVSYVVDAIQFNPSGTPRVVYTRRDSIIAMGDSTRVVSWFVASNDPLGVAPRPDTGGAQRTAVSMAEKMVVGAATMLTDMQRKQLKTHIEQR